MSFALVTTQHFERHARKFHRGKAALTELLLPSDRKTCRCWCRGAGDRG
jgi:hypothetical protein